MMATLSVVLLAGCKEDDQKRELITQKGEAIFQKEGTFRNCEVGELRWLNVDGYTTRINAVVCPNQPVTSVSYKVGKTYTSATQIGTFDSAEETARLRAEAAANARQQAISKLTDDERKLLGLQ